MSTQLDTPTSTQRRQIIKGVSGAALLKILAGAGIIAPTMALAEWNKSAFEAKSMADTLKALGAATPAEGKDIQVTGPDIAENGAVVPVGIATTLPNVTMVAILIEKNPTTLAAAFTLPEGTEANVQTRVKMGQTSNVYALVKSDGKFYMTGKEIKVTLGGCGG